MRQIVISAVAPVRQYFHQHIVVVAGDAHADGSEGGVALRVLVHHLQDSVRPRFAHIGHAVGKQRQPHLAPLAQFPRRQPVGASQPGFRVRAAPGPETPRRPDYLAGVVAIGKGLRHPHLIRVGHNRRPVAGHHLPRNALNDLFRQPQPVVRLH